jgi:hypothetical protein
MDGERMSDTVLVAVLSMVGTLCGSVGGILTANKLTNYRIEQLERRVSEHNNLISRMYAVEKSEAIILEEIEHLKDFHR